VSARCAIPALAARLVREPGGTILYIGAENWPFPIPLAAKGSAWSFDVDAGAREIAKTMVRYQPDSSWHALRE